MSCIIGFVRVVPVAPFNVRVAAEVPRLRSFHVVPENSEISPSTELAGQTTSPDPPHRVAHRSPVACALSATSICPFTHTGSLSCVVEYV